MQGEAMNNEQAAEFVRTYGRLGRSKPAPRRAQDGD